ncbi:MAG: M20/M25/M40 family metallo-hydrolase [Thermodesulfobacteriota bacterium]
MNKSTSFMNPRALSTLMLFICLSLVLCCGDGQTRKESDNKYKEQVKALISRPELVKAFEYVDNSRDEILREWITITEINAPSGKERERAAYIEKLLRQLGLQEIHYDSAGNLIAVRKGTGSGPVVVIDAHLDTVFQEGLKISTTIHDGKIYAPGVGDNARNIEAILATIRALDHANIKTESDLVFVFTVEEETDLRGANAFVKDNKEKINYYIALDAGYEGFTYGGIGIKWYKHHLIGPGGHTRFRTPPQSATLPLARAIRRIYELPLSKSPPTHLNIGMLSGASAVNTKAADAWFTVDLRSTSNEMIVDLEKKIAEIILEEAGRENMTVKTEVILTMPAVQIPGHRESPLVKTAEAVHTQMGFKGHITVTGSNDSIAALLAGIPAISTGTAPCGNSHTLNEWCEIEPFFKGIKKVLLLEVALAQLASN